MASAANSRPFKLFLFSLSAKWQRKECPNLLKYIEVVYRYGWRSLLVVASGRHHQLFEVKHWAAEGSRDLFFAQKASIHDADRKGNNWSETFNSLGGDIPRVAALHNFDHLQALLGLPLLAQCDMIHAGIWHDVTCMKMHGCIMWDLCARVGFAQGVYKCKWLPKFKLLRLLSSTADSASACLTLGAALTASEMWT